MRLSHYTPRYLPQRNENICLRKDLYVNMCGSTVCSSVNLDTMQISINWSMDKQNMVYLDTDVLLGNKKQQSPAPCHDIREPQCYAK